MREKFSFTGLTSILMLILLLLATAFLAWLFEYLNRNAPPSYTRLVYCQQILGKGVVLNDDGCESNRIGRRINEQLG